MDETRRFLRYVLPGLAAFLQIILIIYLNGSINDLKDFVDAGTAIVGFLASGIIGFIFSNFYYLVYWKFYLPFKRCSKLDYLELINSNEDLFKDHLGNKPKTQKEAWTILNVFFNLNFGDKLQYFERKTDSISNILAGIGTSFFIILCGQILGLIFLHFNDTILIYSVCNLLILITLFLNFQLAASILQSLYVRILEWIKQHPNSMIENKEK